MGQYDQAVENGNIDSGREPGVRDAIEILEGSSAEDHSERRGVQTTYPAHMTPQDTSGVPTSQAS